ncbi:MAG: VWA domain-containing protein [Phycisphaeraceae bacterium]
MVRFLDPLLLSWLAVAAVPVVLYLFRHRPRQVSVSTLLFFDAMMRHDQDAAWLRRLKRLLSLLLTLLIIAGAVTAMARLVVAPDSDVQSVVILVDRSASMAAADEAGQTRLQAAADAAGRRVAGLAANVPVAVIAYDVRPEILLPPSLDRRELDRTLRALAVRPMGADVEPAMHLAHQVAAIDTPGGIWHFTDAAPELETGEPGEADEAVREPVATASNPPAEVQVDHVRVALTEAVNVGVTGFALRRAPMEVDRYEAFVEVAGVRADGDDDAAAGPIEAELRITIDGAVAGYRQLSVDVSEPTRLLVPVRAGEGAVLELALTAEGDVLALDDRVVARIPAVEPVRVLWVSDEVDAFMELALSSLGEGDQVSVFHGGPGAWPSDEPVDVVVFQGWLPERWPEDVAVIVVDPPASLGPVQVAALDGSGLWVESLRTTDTRHPLLYGVAGDRLALMQNVVLSADAAGTGLAPLWVGPAGPLLAAGQVRGQRLVVMGFEPGRSRSLPLTASFPMLVGNAIYWCSQEADPDHVGHNRRTGELVQLAEQVTWTDATGQTLADVQPAEGGWLELDRLGLWRDAAGMLGSASLLDGRATTLGGGDAADESTSNAAAGRWFSGELTTLLLWLVVMTLLVESFLFHLHAVR